MGTMGNTSFATAYFLTTLFGAMLLSAVILA